MIRIAHRSGPTVYPEQTIESARLAMEQGADMVEIDVRLTMDGGLAVTHDQNLMRIFGVEKAIYQVTTADFCELRHKAAPQFRSHILADYLETKLPLLIHVKESTVVDALAEAIAPCAERIVLGLQKPEEVEFFRNQCPGVSILSFAPKENLEEMIRMNVDYVRLWENWLEPNAVKMVRESGAALWVMSGSTLTSNVGEPDDEALAKIIEWRPDGILINDVRRLAGR